MLDLLEFAHRLNPEAVEEIGLFREKYGDSPFPPPNNHLAALGIRNKLRDLGADNKTCQAVVSVIIEDRLPVGSVEELADTDVRVLRKAGLGVPILNDLRDAVLRLPEPTGVSEMIDTEVSDHSSRRESYREMQAKKSELIAQLADLDIPKQAFNILKRTVVARTDLRNLEDLAKMGDTEFLGLTGFGETSLQKFREEVARLAEEAKQP